MSREEAGPEWGEGRAPRGQALACLEPDCGPQLCAVVLSDSIPSHLPEAERATESGGRPHIGP